MSHDLYVWRAPRDLDVTAADALVERWLAEGGDPAASPFEPDTDVGWFLRELRQDAPTLAIASDGVPTGSGPVWLAGSDEPPARVVAIRLSPHTSRDDLATIEGLATKYDLVVFDRRGPHLRMPLADLEAYASATFWPGGAIRGLVAGLIGLGLIVGGWILPIPIVNIVLIVIGGFLVLLTGVTFVAEGRTRLRGDGSSPPET